MHSLARWRHTHENISPVITYIPDPHHWRLPLHNEWNWASSFASGILPLPLTQKNAPDLLASFLPANAPPCVTGLPTEARPSISPGFHAFMRYMHYPPFPVRRFAIIREQAHHTGPDKFFLSVRYSGVWFFAIQIHCSRRFTLCRPPKAPPKERTLNRTLIGHKRRKAPSLLIWFLRKTDAACKVFVLTVLRQARLPLLQNATQIISFNGEALILLHCTSLICSSRPSSICKFCGFCVKHLKKL